MNSLKFKNIHYEKMLEYTKKGRYYKLDLSEKNDQIQTQQNKYYYCTFNFFTL